MELREVVAEELHKVAGPRILVVGDELVVRDFLSQALTAEGREVEGCE